MSLQYNPYTYEHIGRKRHQEFIQMAEQHRMMQALTRPRANVLQRMMKSVSGQIADGMRALTRQPRRMQGAS